jgi:hypothetical protein
MNKINMENVFISDSALHISLLPDAVTRANREKEPEMRTSGTLNIFHFHSVSNTHWYVQ